MDVVYLDNHLLVVRKPAGVLAQANETGDEDLLTLGKAYLKERFNKPGNVFLGLVHRLDRPTSGVTVFARTSKAAARLSEQIRQRTVRKRYLAIVEGSTPGEDQWEDCLEKRDRQSFVVKSPRGKRAQLTFQTLARMDDKSLVVVDMATGRHHQIRVQFASRGFPLLGDKRYGSRKTFDGRNLALHCFEMIVDHPSQKKRLTFRVPPDQEWTMFQDALATYWQTLPPADTFPEKA